MRLIIALTLLASPAAAWEFSAVPICTLSHSSAAGDVLLTFDPALPEYTITLTLPAGRWPDAPLFAMVFSNEAPITIQTDRHQLSNDGRSMTAKDHGFSNVLNGLQLNSSTVAISGDTSFLIPLADIGPAMTAFRNCPVEGLS